jgi:acyl carrier protein
MNAISKGRFNFIFKRHFLIPPSQLKKRKYLEDLGLTKLEQIEMLNYFEEEFNIRFSEQDEKRIKTIDDTISILEKYLNYNNSQLKIG